MKNSKYAPHNNSAKALCPCGEKECPNPGTRIIDRAVKGRADTIIPRHSGPRFAGSWDQLENSNVSA